MSIKIMMWNTQHMNNQNQAKPMSEAYTDKKGLLDALIARYSPDLIALFEVGNTGTPNATIVADLSNHYALVGELGQEGGSSKNTTLGSLVFAKNEIASAFSEPEFQPVLGAGHRRASITIRHTTSGIHFAFYHANASDNAWKNIKDEIDYLQDQMVQRQGSWLAFFGGDLNSHEAPPNTTGHGRSMTRRLPVGPGYTHVSIRDSTSVATQSYRRETKNSGGDVPEKDAYVDSYMGSEIEYGVVASLLMLDYAYVAEHVPCTAECKASVQGRKNWLPDHFPHATTTLTYSNQSPKNAFSTVEKSYDGKVVRSDHFPVFYTLDL